MRSVGGAGRAGVVSAWTSAGAAAVAVVAVPNRPGSTVWNSRTTEAGPAATTFCAAAVTGCRVGHCGPAAGGGKSKTPLGSAPGALGRSVAASAAGASLRGAAG